MSVPRLLAQRAVWVVALLGLAGAGCGGSEQTAGEDAAVADAGFPVEIEHKYGTTEIPEAPERVVTVGFNEQDFVLALGVKPVAVREWFGKRPGATWRWAQDELGGTEPEVLSPAELNFEQIARLRPDLILGVYSGITEQEYRTLSRIAPTVTQTDQQRDFGATWQEQLRITGRALGRSERAERLASTIDERFARTREQHPEFEGKTAAMGYALPGGSFGLYASQDSRVRVASSLGFEVPAGIDKLAGDTVAAEISEERFRLLDQDVLVLFEAPGAKREEVESDPLYRRLRAVREGRVLYLGKVDDLSGALSFSSPLSLSYALEESVPRLAAAVDGDRATRVEEAP